jgi:hypothetical protein
MHARFCRLHGVVLIMDGRRGACKVVDLVYFDIQRERNVVMIGAARSLAVFAIVVEATDEKAAAFYRDFGFAPFARCGCFSKMQKVLRAVTQVGRFGQYAPKYLCTRTSGTIASAAPCASAGRVLRIDPRS